MLATLSTIGSFAADTAGTFNRDWYITGGFMLVNGMFVDLFVISCVIQGWGLMLNIGRLVLAPRALTQSAMDALYAGDGANMYVVDRLQVSSTPHRSTLPGLSCITLSCLTSLGSGD